MRLRLLLAAILVCVPPLAHPQAETEGSVADSASMRFEWVKEGPSEACGDHCREWIAATGPITADTVKDFQIFAEAREMRGATLVLDSGGGSVLGSLELGRQVRRLNMKTTVGRTIKLPDRDGQERARLSARGECASMCVFVLLGGLQRTIPPEARVLVHQIWPGTKRYDASAENYTAEELVRIQRDLGRIARYTVEMGGDIELFEIAMRIPPWERLRSLSQAELRRMRLQSVDTVSDVPTSGAVSLERSSRATRAATPERGWMLAAEGGHTLLTRKHPLTLEGDEIGQFEIVLSCAEGGGGFRVAYSDSRALSADDPGLRLKDVAIWVGSARIDLALETSIPQAGAGELRSTAAGLLSAPLLEKFRREGNGTIVVGTRMTDNTRTSIRVGGAGFAKEFPRLSSGCTGQAVSRLDQ